MDPSAGPGRSFRTPGTGAVTLRWETVADLACYPHLGVTLRPDKAARSTRARRR